MSPRAGAWTRVPSARTSEGIWYMKVTKEDIPEIIDTYLKLQESDNAQADTSPAPVGK